MTVTPKTFYFIHDSYFQDFPDPCLMQNKEMIGGQPHGRPCFYAFEDPQTHLIWLIPFSSRIKKFHDIANKKIAKRGYCNTILFGEVLGHEKAFLIQNMCPITPKYLDTQYTNNEVVVKIDGAFESKLIQCAQQVLALTRQGQKLIVPDVLAIECALLAQMQPPKK